jgi:peptidoglycan/LPS O-acetylase OafA/YrhL
LDGLRGVCAITVLLFHCKGMFGAGHIVPHGYLAVDVFFILSGFVIALTYEERLRSGFAFGAFMRARALRLLPTFWLGVIFSAVIFGVFHLPTSAGTSIPPADLIVFVALTALLIPQLSMPTESLFPTLDAAWSLFAEEIVNILYGALLFRLGARRLFMMAAACWLAVIATEQSWVLGWKLADFWIGMCRAGGGFLAGVVMARCYRDNWFERLPVVSAEAIFFIWVAIASLPYFGAVVDAAIVVIIAPLMIALLVRSDHKAPDFCTPLGAISYPLYVTHWTLVHLAFSEHVFRQPHPILAIGMVMICLIVAWIANKTVELGKRKFLAPAKSSLSVLSAES